MGKDFGYRRCSAPVLFLEEESVHTFFDIKPAPKPEDTSHEILHQRHKSDEGGSVSGSLVVGHEDQRLMNAIRASTSASLKHSGHPIYQK